MLSPSFADVRTAWRRITHRPGYAVTVLVILALGIGINTVVFSIADAALFRGLPYPNGSRILEVFTADSAGKASMPGLSPASFVEWRRQTEVFEALEGYDYGTFVVTGGSEPEQINGSYITSGLFDALGVRAARGRTFAADEGEPGKDRVVIIGDGMWRQRFGARADIIGQSIGLNDQSFTVIGVMPPHFRFPGAGQQVWIPRTPIAALDGRLEVIAVLQRGLNVDVVQERLVTLANALNAAHPRPAGWNVKLMPPRGVVLNPPTRRALQILTAAVIVVLLIACANVANLFLAEALGRRRELAIRAALGATRGRLIRELLSESLLLGVGGGLVGLALAWWGVEIAIRLAPTDITRFTINEIRIDGRILLGTVALTLATGIVFGILPAWRGSRPDAGEALKSRTESGGLATAHLRSGLAVVEVALSVLLLTGATLLIRSFVRLQTLDPGFKPAGLMSVMLTLPTDRYPAPARRAFLEQLRQRVVTLPGVQAVAFGNGVPTSGGILHFPQLEAEGERPETEETILPRFEVDASYFSTLGIPIRAGRGFTDDEPASSAVINEVLAKRLWPAGNAIGRRFRFGSDESWWTIVGIAGNVRGSRMVERQSTALMYSPIWRGVRTDTPQVPKPSGGVRTFSQVEMVVRASQDAALLDGIKRAVWAIDGSQPVRRAVLVEDLLADSLAEDRFAAALMGTFAALALILAGAGLYAVLAHLVAQRRQEIGIRMALGASAAATTRLILSRGLALGGTGVILGVGAAWLSARVLSSQLYDVHPHDPWAFGGVSFAVLGLSLLACWLPARRALSIDPATVLRAE